VVAAGRAVANNPGLVQGGLNLASNIVAASGGSGQVAQGLAAGANGVANAAAGAGNAGNAGGSNASAQSPPSSTQPPSQLSSAGPSDVMGMLSQVLMAMFSMLMR
jgi:hypothetical protein